MRHCLTFSAVLLFLLFSGAATCLPAQTDSLAPRLSAWFDAYRLDGFAPVDPLRPAACETDSLSRRVRLTVAEAFAEQPLTPGRVAGIRAALEAIVDSFCPGYTLELVDRRGYSLGRRIPNRLRRPADIDPARLWTRRAQNKPWVTDVSRPWRPTRGLEGRHLFVWPSHGRFWHEGQRQWKWQRPRLFATCEDLLSQSFVYPYLVPMLERAGAVVGLPRERDGQPVRVVVDNDTPLRPDGVYCEQGDWLPGRAPGFGLPLHASVSDSLGMTLPEMWLAAGENPFALGSSRRTAAAPEGRPTACVRWTPRLPRDGRYAVYVSYATEPDAVDDARYCVRHAGGTTEFRVNQRMGGGTWVYLGTFHFAVADSAAYVELTNESASGGTVSADAVRLGGGPGLVAGADSLVSGLPASLECAAAYAQWAGMPEEVYRSDAGRLGYDADIRARSRMLARLGGTSVYQPDSAGLGVPFELSLALHTDAGIRHGGPVGMLSIATTEAEGDTLYASGLSRLTSLDLGDRILSELRRDIAAETGLVWPHRGLRDRNYGETRSPRVPAAIVELLSHQNFEDMKLAHDPHFKFLAARAIYKALLRHVAFSHGEPEPVVQPLPPHGLRAVLTDGGDAVRLGWEETPDSLEVSARAEGYVVYTGDGRGGFDNGHLVRGATEIVLPVVRGRLHAFRVTAVNAGGESLPSATVACYSATAPGAPEVLVVDGFDRLSGPARVDAFGRQGFDLDADLGVPEGRVNYFCGRQRVFDTEPAASWGASGSELEGRTLTGNTRDHAVTHGMAIAASDHYSFSSAEASALPALTPGVADYAAIDYIAGLNRHARHNLRPYRALPEPLRPLLAGYVAGGGHLLVSGSHVGSDMTRGDERAFCRDVLHCSAPEAAPDTTGFVRGLGLDSIPLTTRWNAMRYAASRPEVIAPAAGAFAAFVYGNGTSAGIAWRGSGAAGGRVVTLGFPVECIADDIQRQLALDALLRFLTEP